MTDGTYCAKCRGPVKGYDTYCDRCGDTSEETEMTDNMLPIAFEPEHIGAICRAFGINWDSQYGMNNASFTDDIVERIEDLQRYVKEMEALLKQAGCPIIGQGISIHSSDCKWCAAVKAIKEADSNG